MRSCERYVADAVGCVGLIPDLTTSREGKEEKIGGKARWPD
jgi:hypothetical protein